MKVYHRLSDLRRVRGRIWLAAGFFDGVHRGHASVIRRALKEARADSARVWIMTFDSHPLKLLAPGAAPALLTALDHKLRLLARTGAEGCVALRFTRRLAGARPEDFVERLARSAPGLRGMAVGDNWTFGRNGSGTPRMLAKLGARHGFRVSVVPRVRRGGRPVSSTRIRRAVAAGRLDEARDMLGRPFSVVGRIVRGRGVARTLGAPTANVRVRNEVLPARGVYAVRALLGGRAYGAVAHIGPGGRSPDSRAGAGLDKLEAHLLGLRANLVGREMELVFVKRLRRDRHFVQRAALKEQVARDIAAAAGTLARRGRAGARKTF